MSLQKNQKINEQENGLSSEGLKRPDIHRQAPVSPIARRTLKNTPGASSAKEAAAIIREVPCRYLIAVTSDYLFAAMMAEGVLSFLIVNIANIDITYSVIDGDFSGHSKGFNQDVCFTRLANIPVLTELA